MLGKKNTFQTAQGVSIPFTDKIKEEYQVYEECLELNLSFEKIKPMLLDFIKITEEPLFIVLQLPLSEQEEPKLRQDNTAPFHRKVYYLDGQTKKQVLWIIEKYGELILNDGISQFAIASHVTNDDFFIQKYKLIHIYSKEPSKFYELIKKYGVAKTTKITTAWDTFSQQNPGQVQSIKIKDKTIYDVYDELSELGMYDAKIIED
jgi:hypothetical protein